MDYAAYIIALEALKKLFENRIIGIIPAIEDFAVQALLNWIDESLEIRKGSLTASDETIDILNDFDRYFLQVITNMSVYKGAVSGMLKELPKISKVMQQYQEAVNGISWAAAHVGPVQKLVVNEIIEAYSENGLNQNFVQPLRDLLYQNIAAGTNIRDAKESLKDYIKSSKGKDSKIARYLTQTSQQAVDSYTGIINKKLMDTFDYPYLQMSGSLIKTSAPQCVKGINEYEGLIDVETWEKVIKPLAEKNGLIAGTTFKNLPFNKLHWGCRHEFTPTMVKVEEEKKEEEKSKDKKPKNIIPPVVPPINNDNGSSYNNPDEWEIIQTHENGGFIKVHVLVDKNANDYKKVVDCCNHFSVQGEGTYVLPDIKNSETTNYKRIFGELIGTMYERKCPDFRVGKLFYEHEGFTTTNKKRALSNMLSRGLDQSSRIVIDDAGHNERYLKKRVFDRVKEGQKIDEVWLLKDRNLNLIYKKTKPH